MDAVYEAKYHQLEEEQWWFKARRDIVFKLIKGFELSPSAAILEIGCSGGPLMTALRDAGFDAVTGIDVSEVAIDLARQRGLTNIALMDGAKLEFPDARFDLVVASDVLEHIEDEAAALHEWKRTVRPGGRLIIFVPAFRLLWGKHDEINHHFRRYSGSELRQAIEAAGLQIERMSYWNSVLAVPTAVLRLVRRAVPAATAAGETGDLLAPPRVINQALLRLVSAENKLLLRMNLPFGTSVFAVARRTA